MAKLKKVETKLDRHTEGDRRQGNDRRKQDIPVASDRRKVARRRQIDPTTCERDYSGEEIEFMQALDKYKRTSGRMFPTCSEILEVIRGLGYQRTLPTDSANTTAEAATTAETPPTNAPSQAV